MSDADLPPGETSGHPADPNGAPPSGPGPLVGPAPRGGPSFAQTLLVAAGTLVAVGLLGAPIGWLWSLVAPRAGYIKVEGGYLYADPEPEQIVAADAWFLIIGLGAGLVLALAAWLLLRRHRGVMVLLALVLGSLAGAMVAYWLGHRIGMDQFQSASAAAANGDRINGPLGLRITDLNTRQWWKPLTTGVAAAQAAAAAVLYTCLAGFSRYDDLRGAATELDDASEYDLPPVDQVG
jgi:hypothetical protein